MAWIAGSAFGSSFWEPTVIATVVAGMVSLALPFIGERAKRASKAEANAMELASRNQAAFQGDLLARLARVEAELDDAREEGFALARQLSACRTRMESIEEDMEEIRQEAAKLSQGASVVELAVRVLDKIHRKEHSA